MSRTTTRRSSAIVKCPVCGLEFSPWRNALKRTACCCRSHANFYKWSERRTKEFFLAKVAKHADTGCWEFMGYSQQHRRKRYGRLAWGIRNDMGGCLPQTAARVAYSLWREIPLVDVPRLSARCLSKNCCNPDHWAV